MLTFTAKLTVKTGGEEEFERTMRAALDAHRAHLKEMNIDLQAALDGAPKLGFYEKLVSHGDLPWDD